MVRIFIWIGYIAAFVTAVHLPFQVARWRATRRLYGRIPWSLTWQTGIYSTKNKMLRFQLGVLAGLCILVIPVIVNFVGSDILGILRPLSAAARPQRLPTVLIFLWQLDRVAAYLLPPAVLFLGTAGSVNIHLVAVLNRILNPNRVVSLLDLKEHIFTPFVNDFMFNNLRTTNGYEWRMVVHHLMDVVPLIIVDTAVRTEYVEAEIQRIERFGLGYKVISFSTAAHGPEINSGETRSRTVVEAARRLGRELALRAQMRLDRPSDDIERRWTAQQNYMKMIQSVPRPVRFNADVNAMLIKANFILDWTIKGYIRDCKLAASGEYADWLLEDIPSRVSLAQEEAYLWQSRGLDEVRGIYRSCLDLALHTPDPDQNFNIANAHNKIGRCARFSRDWETALDHFEQTIEILTRMASNPNTSSMDLGGIQKELVAAYFLRGEVHMARYRQNALIADRDRAASDFRASIALDDELGEDSSETARRLASLANTGRK